MSECRRTHVTGTEYKTMLMGKDSDGKDMMQKDPGEKRIQMQKKPDATGLGWERTGWKGNRCTRIRILKASNLNI